jgi:hypothetical protein
VRRAVRSALISISVALLARPVQSQESRLSPREIGEIVDVVLDSLVPPSERLSRVAVGKRGIFLDVPSTVKSFGYFDSASAPTLADLYLRNPVKAGSLRLLDDCSQAAPKSCSQLGWSVYVSVIRLSSMTSPIRIQAGFVWPDRSGETFLEGVVPNGRTNLVGFSQGGMITRSSLGKWQFVRDKGTVVM